MYVEGFAQNFHLSKLNERNGRAWAKDCSSSEQDLKDRFLPSNFEDICRRQLVRQKIQVDEPTQDYVN